MTRAQVCDYCGERGSTKRRVVMGVDGKRAHAACRPVEYRAAQARAWQQANPEKVGGYKARWYAKTADERRAKAKAYRDRLTPEERRQRRLASEARNVESVAAQRRKKHLRRYGLTVEQYDAMVEAQGGLCAICGQPETAVTRGRVVRLSVDHNHGTGAVRALLCRRCNVAVGVMENDGDHLIARVRTYLEAHDAGR